MTREHGPNEQPIAQEIRKAYLGSFPLSPGTMSGHYAIARLHYDYSESHLTNSSIESVFGSPNPNPPTLIIPNNHRPVDAVSGNTGFWKNFLSEYFGSGYRPNPISDIRELIDINSESDRINFDIRLSGGKSRLIVRRPPTPSLLRAFLYENLFPSKNDFFVHVFSEMRQEIRTATINNFQDNWSGNLKLLIEKWDSKMKRPFIGS